MLIHEKPVRDLTAEDLLALVGLEVKEGRGIEYKESLPGPTESDKKEFLADVSSFANASGGDLLYGVTEKRDADNKHTGVPESFPGVGEVNLSVEQQRLENILQSGLAPRVFGVDFASVVVPPREPVLILRVPRSWSGPHMVCYQDWCRFYSRNSSGKCLLDVEELRRAFVRSEATSQLIRTWQTERLARIATGETPVPLSPGPKIVLHLMPLAAVDRIAAVELAPVVQNPALLPPIYTGGWDHRHNFDGFVSFSGPGSDGAFIDYTQLLRNGSIEAVTTSFFNEDAHRIAPSYEERLIMALREYLKLGLLLRVVPPLAVMVSMTSVRGYTMALGLDYHQPRYGGIDRDVLVGRETLVEDMAADPVGILRPCLDAIWNACGYRRSMNYAESGEWKGL